ncbi:hypothetical protein ABPG77_008640 [Micractinium sp. CCAP 211/92]
MREDSQQPLLEDGVPAKEWTLLRCRSRATLFLAATGLLLVSAAALAAFGLIRSSGLGLPASSRQPFCRKSSSIAVLPRDVAADGPGSGQPGLDMVAWSGMGKHKHILDDLHAFDLTSHTWRRLRPQPGPHPTSRWKAGNAQAVQGGLVVVGGDAYWPGTFRHEYLMDVWRLGYPALGWSEARLQPSAARPLARRGHSLAHYRGQDGLARIVLFGGRTRDKVLLNDAWEVAVLWTEEGGGQLNATWQQLAPLQPAGEAAPAPRRGHSAVMLQHPDGPQMLVYGGREDLDYYGDLWLLDIAGRSWRRLEVAAGVAPSPRDHHSAAVFQGEMVVFGGHTGLDYRHAHPAHDVWAFHLANSTWREVKPAGPHPLPRFEEAYVQYTPPGSTEASRLLVYAGQTAHVCQLNDVYELDMASWRWQQLAAPSFCTSECRKRYG